MKQYYISGLIGHTKGIQVVAQGFTMCASPKSTKEDPFIKEFLTEAKSFLSKAASLQGLELTGPVYVLGWNEL